MNRKQQYLAAALTLALPFLYIKTWNPFSLNGPHFLVFYILLSLVVYIFPVTRKLSFILLILGIARIIQGLYNEKPVLYLLLLVILNIILTLSINASIWKTQRSSKE